MRTNEDLALAAALQLAYRLNSIGALEGPECRAAFRLADNIADQTKYAPIKRFFGDLEVDFETDDGRQMLLESLDWRLENELLDLALERTLRSEVGAMPWDPKE